MLLRYVIGVPSKQSRDSHKSLEQDPLGVCEAQKIRGLGWKRGTSGEGS